MKRSLEVETIHYCQIVTDLWFAHVDGAVVLPLHALRVDLQVQLAHARRDRLLHHVVKVHLCSNGENDRWTGLGDF